MQLTWYILVPSSTVTQHWQERFYFDAFFKLTGGNPRTIQYWWQRRFFKRGESTTSRIEPKISKRHIAPGQKRDIMHSKEWNAGREPTAERFQDDDSVLPILGKTPRMLQDCYDKLKARKDASLEANPQQ
jgi:hypothetical protein